MNLTKVRTSVPTFLTKPTNIYQFLVVQRTSIKCPISHRANKLHYLARYGWIANSAAKDKIHADL
jgi:hypothetical protein